MMKDDYKTLKVGCGKFIYGKGAIKELVSEIKHLGGKPLFLGGKTTLDLVNQCIAEQLANEHIVSEMITYEGSCSHESARFFAEKTKTEGFSVLVGVGGGKCIDLAKCTSLYADLPVITVPTSIATCAATAAVCIMYDTDGKPAGSTAMQKEVDVCIADSSIIVKAPRRLLASGIFDSMAKLPEVVHNKKYDSYLDCDLDKYISAVNSRIIYDFLLGEGPKAYDLGEGYEKFDDIILTNLLHTSVVSGFSSGSGQLALAHALYTFIRQKCTEEGMEYLHGEIVAVGIIMQMVFNRNDEVYINQVVDQMRHMGLRTKLTEIGCDASPKQLDALRKILANNAQVDVNIQGNLLEQAIARVR